MSLPEGFPHRHAAARKPEDIFPQLAPLPPAQEQRSFSADDGKMPMSVPEMRVNDRTLIQSVNRALDILETLAAHPQPLKLQQIASVCGLNNATCHHLLNTLVFRRYVMRHADNRSYTLSDGVMALLRYDHQGTFDLVGLVLPDLRSMATDLDETMVLARFTGSSLVLVAQQDNGHVLRDRPKSAEDCIGAAHATAFGKAMLAWLPEVQIARVVADQGLTAFTPRTLNSLAALVDSLRQIRRHGFAVEDEEFAEGICGIACALRGKSGRVLGALGCWLPRERASSPRLKTIAQRLTHIGQTLTVHLQQY
ncbi:IclR family transcriptional regulator [Martelella alba]|uniref:IclR family transcriptional regulator n=1 Tax=Martelella alba TaxID=2590451 RepID=A0ABY2SH65_9HYPH|nr:IclR family transcriptional regulator [Martelella alba]TKI04608.1 IclR family transcriptional regulator [Martelella alba]